MAYSDRPPVSHMVHYEMSLRDDRVMEPGDLGLGDGLSVPDRFKRNAPFRVNLCLALYKAAMLLNADMLEVENHRIYSPGEQKNFENFLEYHTLKYGWEYPRAMNLSWNVDAEGFRGNMVCVASKYDGVTDIHESDVTMVGREGIFNKERGVSLGVDPDSDMGTFGSQFRLFEPPFRLALASACRTGKSRMMAVFA